jgi:hypothetical protein
MEMVFYEILFGISTILLAIIFLVMMGFVFFILCVGSAVGKTYSDTDIIEPDYEKYVARGYVDNRDPYKDKQK